MTLRFLAGDMVVCCGLAACTSINTLKETANGMVKMSANPRCNCSLVIMKLSLEKEVVDWSYRKGPVTLDW